MAKKKQSSIKKVGKFLAEVARGELGFPPVLCRQCEQPMLDRHTMYLRWHQCVNKKCPHFGLMFQEMVE